MRVPASQATQAGCHVTSVWRRPAPNRGHHGWSGLGRDVARFVELRRAHQRMGEMTSIPPNPDGRGSISHTLLIGFGFSESVQVPQRLLPTEITGLRRNDVRDAFL